MRAFVILCFIVALSCPINSLAFDDFLPGPEHYEPFIPMSFSISIICDDQNLVKQVAQEFITQFGKRRVSITDKWNANIHISIKIRDIILHDGTFAGYALGELLSLSMTDADFKKNFKCDDAPPAKTIDITTDWYISIIPNNRHLAVYISDSVRDIYNTKLYDIREKYRNFEKFKQSWPRRPQDSQ